MSSVAPNSVVAAAGVPVVRADGVVKRWGSTLALAGASMEIGPGVTGLLGANGSGKTTLLGLLLGLHPPDEGRLEVLGLDPSTGGPEVRERVGYSPEHHLLPPDVKAVDFVRHIAELHGLPRREATGRASDVLWQVGLGEERIRPIGTFSTGQRQRVKLAQAIVHDPVLVLLDEPTEGLDPVQRDDMLRLIRRIGTEFGIHAVLSSHVLDEVERVADNAVILHAGQVVAAGPLDQLRSGGGGMVVEIDGDIRPVAEALQATGSILHWDGTRLFVSAAVGQDHDTLADLVRDVLAELAVPVRRLQPRVLTLEEVFLSAGRTGGQAYSQTPAPAHTRNQPPTGGSADGAPPGGGTDLQPSAGVGTPLTARILDRGYRRYSGERRGVRGAVRTVTFHSIQRALGMRRTAWAKLLPILIIAISYIPAIVFVGIVSFIPDEDLAPDLLPTYGTYFGYIQAAVILFVAVVAPEILCTDRRTGMLGVYLASPLTRDTYLLAKALATAAVLAFVTIGPPFLMLVAFIVQGQGPDGPAGVALTVVRIVGAGLIITILYTAFSMGVSSLTDRKAFATAGLIMFFLLSNVVTGVLAGALELGENVLVINIFYLPFAIVEKIHGESEIFPDATTSIALVGGVAWTVVWAAVCRVRYQHLQVTK